MASARTTPAMSRRRKPEMERDRRNGRAPDREAARGGRGELSCDGRSVRLADARLCESADRLRVALRRTLRLPFLRGGCGVPLPAAAASPVCGVTRLPRVPGLLPAWQGCSARASASSRLATVQAGSSAGPSPGCPRPRKSPRSGRLAVSSGSSPRRDATWPAVPPRGVRPKRRHCSAVAHGRLVGGECRLQADHAAQRQRLNAAHHSTPSRGRHGPRA